LYQGLYLTCNSAQGECLATQGAHGKTLIQNEKTQQIWLAHSSQEEKNDGVMNHNGKMIHNANIHIAYMLAAQHAYVVLHTGARNILPTYGLRTILAIRCGAPPRTAQTCARDVHGNQEHTGPRPTSHYICCAAQRT
jgi:hypothetical protein